MRSPQSVGLSQYLAALKRVDNALTDLNATNLRSNQKAISEFNILLSTGSGKLQDMFRSSLSENFSPVEPLHYLTKRVSWYLLMAVQERLLTVCVQNFLSQPFPEESFPN